MQAERSGFGFFGHRPRSLSEPRRVHDHTITSEATLKQLLRGASAHETGAANSTLASFNADLVGRMRPSGEELLSQENYRCKPYFDPALCRDPRQRVRLTRKMIRLGLFRVLDSRSVRCRCGSLLCQKERRRSKKDCGRATDESLLSTTGTRVAAHFRKFRPGGIALAGMHRVDVKDGYEAGSTVVVLACSFHPMGFSWSLYFAQRINERVFSETQGRRTQGFSMTSQASGLVLGNLTPGTESRRFCGRRAGRVFCEINACPLAFGSHGLDVRETCHHDGACEVWMYLDGHQHHAVFTDRRVQLVTEPSRRCCGVAVVQWNWRKENVSQVGRVAKHSRFRKMPGASVGLHALALLIDDPRFSFSVLILYPKCRFASHKTVLRTPPSGAAVPPVFGIASKTSVSMNPGRCSELCDVCVGPIRCINRQHFVSV